jgi:hypothetical protein
MTGTKGLIILSLVLFVLACAGENKEVSPAPTVKQKPKPKPLKVILIDDTSGSTPNHGIKRVRKETLLPIIEALKIRGGEFAFCMIDENAYDMPLVRLALKPPPEKPQEPEKRDKKEPAYLYNRRMVKFSEKMGKYKPLETEYNKHANARIAAFWEEAKTIFNKKNTPLSDVWGAINAADRFLSEPVKSDPQRFMIINSDCLHNTKTVLGPIKSNAKIFIVNTSGINTKIKKIRQLANVRNYSSLDVAIGEMLRSD